jgi:hypothetical protein
MKGFLFLGCTVIILLQACTKKLSDIISETEKATFTIYTYDEFGAPSGSGSGFFIDPNGIGITNYHVLDGAVKAIVKTAQGEEFKIKEVIASDKKWDIVKFKIESFNTQFPILKFARNTPSKGAKVYNISAPLGLENTVSEGIVSSYREDQQHGHTVQITAPISPGSSGSAILNEKGECFAVATFQKSRGQNLNFGVLLDQDKLELLKSNDFNQKNPSFNRGDNFVLLNIPSTQGAEVMLHAIEFKDNMTIGYFSYTNLNLSIPNAVIWCELNKKDAGFLIHDKDLNIKYYLTSSTIGVNKTNGTPTPLASCTRFKVFFPAIKNKLKNIDIVYGYTSRGWQFMNINLDEYREKISVNADSYFRDYAYVSMQEGDLEYSASVFSNILENNPDDELALNAMGIISYVLDNNNDAQYYFSKAIESNPSSTTGLLNRVQLYRNHQEYSKALNDLNRVIAIDPAQPDNYLTRAYLYADIKEWRKAIQDMDEVIKSEDFKRDAYAYMYRAIFKAHDKDRKGACKDIQIAYNLTSDSELEKQLEGLWEQLGCK